MDLRSYSYGLNGKRLSQPDRGLRIAALKMQTGQRLSNKELARFADRQAVESEYLRSAGAQAESANRWNGLLNLAGRNTGNPKLAPKMNMGINKGGLPALFSLQNSPRAQMEKARVESYLEGKYGLGGSSAIQRLALEEAMGNRNYSLARGDKMTSSAEIERQKLAINPEILNQELLEKYAQRESSEWQAKTKKSQASNEAIKGDILEAELKNLPEELEAKNDQNEYKTRSMEAEARTNAAKAKYADDYYRLGVENKLAKSNENNNEAPNKDILFGRKLIRKYNSTTAGNVNNPEWDRAYVLQRIYLDKIGDNINDIKAAYQRGEIPIEDYKDILELGGYIRSNTDKIQNISELDKKNAKVIHDDFLKDGEDLW